MHKRKIINFNSIGLIGVSALSLLAVAMLCPTITETTSALQCNGNEGEAGECEEGYSSTTATMSVDVPVASMISIGLQNELTIEITPKSTNNEVARGIAKLAVDTNNESGYAVYMTTQNGTSLTSGSSNALSQKIESIESAGSITDNKWGYAIGAPGTGETVETFNPIPSTSKQITATTATDTSKTDTYDLTFGVLINTDLPAGTYSGSVVVSAVANPIQITNLRQLVFMQDMTSSICEGTPMPQNINGEEITVTKQLVDSRDGKKYWVAKLRDGNCWMTQNLALDLSTSRTLTPADTNVLSNYTPTATTRVDNTATTTSNKISPEFSGSEVSGYDTFTNQWSWGTWKYTVLAKPETTGPCGKVYSTDQLYQICNSIYIDVTNWQPTFAAQQGTITLGSTEYTGLIAVDPIKQSYDAHYLVGNYYQYNTATAGTGGALTTSVNATSSICPKGWALPRSGGSSSTLSRDTDNGTFANLLKAYGVNSKLSSTAPADAASTSEWSVDVTLRNYNVKLANASATNSTPNNINGSTVPYNVMEEQFNIAGFPLSFVHSGNVSPRYGRLDGAIQYGYYWSRGAFSTEYVYSLFFDVHNNSVQPSDRSTRTYRYHGFPIRCLAE